jgi:prepilin-type N-terminal cleavage/methylation domain-containing protein
MKRQMMKHRAKWQREEGFTLIEILIVVVLLGILATIIIPQLGVSSDDAKVNSVKTNLANMRSAIELYFYQHNSIYPGQNDITGAPTAVVADAQTAFVQQLTQFTDLNGVVSTTKNSTYNIGPYIRGALPANAFNDLNTVVCDVATTDITAKVSSGTAGWKFYTQTGTLMSDDGAHDSL